MIHDMNKIQVTRRQALLASACALPAALLPAMTPAFADVVLAGESGGISIEVADPPVNWDSYEPNYTVAIYNGQNGDQVGDKELGYGCLPQNLVLTNKGISPVSGISGTFSLQMRDLGTDAKSSAGTDATRATSNGREGFTVVDTHSKNSNGGGVFTWRYAGTVQPGERVELPLKYYVNYPFANVDYEVLLTASVDGQDDAANRLGTVKGFAYYW